MASATDGMKERNLRISVADQKGHEGTQPTSSSGSSTPRSWEGGCGGSGLAPICEEGKHEGSIHRRVASVSLLD